MDRKILIIVAKFNDFITRQLLVGAEDQLSEGGWSKDQYSVLWVPGCFEIPTLALKAAASKKFSAIICLGAVIRGETAHFDFVAGQAASGIMKASMDTGVPIIFGIITTENIEQALSRSGIKGGNKGRDAASAALDMIKTNQKLQELCR